MLQKNRKGFTLAELLIVVAIIGVLVAIAIPIFSGQLKKAKLATDQANVRSAKAAAAAEYMSDGESGPVSYLYDGSHAVNLRDGGASFSGNGYGKSDNGDGTGATGIPKDGYVEVTVNDSAADQITARWISSAGASALSTGDFTVTGAITNKSLIDQVKKAGLEPSDLKTITASDGTVIDNKNGIQSLFKGFDNVTTIDLSKTSLKTANALMFQDMPKSVNQIILPKVGSSYNIYGIWYDKDGTQLPSADGSKKEGLENKDGSRVNIEKLKPGDSIYRTPPTKK